MDSLNEIEQVFKDILGDKFCEFYKVSPILQRITKLYQAIGNGEGINTLDIADKFLFFTSLSDALALSIASGNKRDSAFTPLSISDYTLLDRKKDLKAPFGREETKYFEWIFSKKVQAKINSLYNIQVRDLRTSFKDKAICDYKIDHENNVELIECKRFNLVANVNSEKSLHHCKNKILAQFNPSAENGNNAHKQFKNTAELLKLQNSRKHLIVDINCYVPMGLKKTKLAGVKYTGFDSNWICSLLNIVILKVMEIKGNNIDKLTITWDELIYIDSQPIAVCNRTALHHFVESYNSLDYDGGSVEFYTHANTKGYTLSAAKASSSIERIHTHYRNINVPGAFFRATDIIQN